MNYGDFIDFLKIIYSKYENFSNFFWLLRKTVSIFALAIGREVLKRICKEGCRVVNGTVAKLSTRWGPGFRSLTLPTKNSGCRVVSHRAWFGMEVAGSNPADKKKSKILRKLRFVAQLRIEHSDF